MCGSHSWRLCQHRWARRWTEVWSRQLLEGSSCFFDVLIDWILQLSWGQKASLSLLSACHSASWRYFRELVPPDLSKGFLLCPQCEQARLRMESGATAMFLFLWMPHSGLQLSPSVFSPVVVPEGVTVSVNPHIWVLGQSTALWSVLLRPTLKRARKYVRP